MLRLEHDGGFCSPPFGGWQLVLSALDALWGRISAGCNGSSRNAHYDRASRHIFCYNRICSNRSFVAYGNTAEHSDSAANPDLCADSNRARRMSRIANGDFFRTVMIPVANAGIFADHASASDGYAGKNDDVNAA